MGKVHERQLRRKRGPKALLELGHAGLSAITSPHDEVPLGRQQGHVRVSTKDVSIEQAPNNAARMRVGFSVVVVG
jgi:hypothetical protein